MAKINTTAQSVFLKGRMNKDFDERVIPAGEYVDALNIRIGSSEGNSVGAIENSKGNEKLTTVRYNGSPISDDAKCIGVYEDGSKETIYWLICDPGVVDMVVSFNERTDTLIYHVVSTTALNFSLDYLVTGIDLVDNLLFFTDNLNPPRKININTSYGPTVTSEDISVIVAPPSSSPTWVGLNVAGEENYINDKFISFAYRYKYKDNEYSAMSQFSTIAFTPGNFNLDYSTFTNESMQNIFNSVQVTINTGNHNVIGVDVCFKLSDSNIINVIEKYNKSEMAWDDNEEVSIQFTNRKIYTTLTESELLRLYDNVPRVAKAQTVMGNRLIYGNYVDGYDIDVNLNYNVELISEPINFYNIPYLLSTTNYTLDTPVSVDDSRIRIDLSNMDLKEGSLLLINFSLESNSYSGDSNFNDEPDSPAVRNQFEYPFIFTLVRDYNSVNDLATSAEFVNAIETSTLFADRCLNTSLSDIFACGILSKDADPPFGAWLPVGMGIDSDAQGFLVSSAVGSNYIYIDIPAVKFETEDPLNPGTYLYGYEYFNNLNLQVSFSEDGSRQSLHSNRDFEVAVVYMDDYLRSSTALVATNNTVFVPASGSINKNYIRATINSIAPSWATRYKFVVKPSRSMYQTIYTNLFFTEDTGYTWFKLEGDNRSKVKDDGILIVKSDTDGPTNTLIKTKVLAVESKIEDFISSNVNESATLIIEPGGVYMKLKPSNFAATYVENSFIDYGQINGNKSYSQVAYPCHIINTDDTPGATPVIPYTIPAGSRITIYMALYRVGDGSGCDGRKYVYDKTFYASQDYDNLKDFIDGQNIDLTSGESTGAEENLNDYLPALGTYAPFNVPIYGKRYLAPITTNPWTNRYTFQEDTDVLSLTYGGLYFIAANATPSCGGSKSRTNVRITVQRAVDLMVFETEADEANPDIYYEGSDSFPIVNRYHMSGNADTDQDQTPYVPAVVDLNFFDCFTFGNGVESYKIDDSLVGAPFYLGSRITAVSQEDFKEAHRYADLTYSGVYNEESNLNKLNEFNLGLSNFKPLEKVFGPINKLYARKTDILVLQEDKISYVLAGKNLLSDAAAGGAITSIPEVLGTQIARIEDYGISNNPESFAVMGSEIFFTDTKRNSVLNLKGGSYQSEQLDIISNYGMKNWFRDEFKVSYNNQKIGGYDPYMDEYVLSINDNSFGMESTVYNCGTSISQKLVNSSNIFTLDLGNTVGEVIINYQFASGSATINISYNGSTVVNTAISGDGFVSFIKDEIYPYVATVTVTATSADYNMSTNCPLLDIITVHRIVLNSGTDAGKTVHNAYNWSLNGIANPFSSELIVFESDGVSLNESRTGYASTGSFPVSGSTVSMQCNKLVTDTFDFDDTVNSFKYLAYPVELDIDVLVTILNTATPDLKAGTFQSSFVYNNPLKYEHLYLVWDYTISTAIMLLFDESDSSVACSDITESQYFINTNLFSDAESVYVDEYLTVKAADGYYAIDGMYRQQYDGFLLTLTACP